jgi:hypothetical protein
MDSFYEIAQERLAPYNCRFVRKFSMDALAQFEDDSLDFVYIDGNHRLPWVLDDICGWMIKVRAGGIVAGHDYYVSKRKNTHNHSKYAVDCVTGAFRIDPWFLSLSWMASGQIPPLRTIQGLLSFIIQSLLAKGQRQMRQLSYLMLNL